MMPPDIVAEAVDEVKSSLVEVNRVEVECDGSYFDELTHQVRRERERERESTRERERESTREACERHARVTGERAKRASADE